MRLLLTDIVGTSVEGSTGDPLGRIADLIATASSDGPRVDAVVVGHGEGTRIVPWEAVDRAADGRLRLRGTGTGSTRRSDFEARLVRDVLDTQIVDVRGRRLTRVADVVLAVPDSGAPAVVTAVDVSAAAVLRRLGLRRLAARMPTRELAWSDLHPLHDPARTLQLEGEPRPELRGRVRYPRLGRRLRRG